MTQLRRSDADYQTLFERLGKRGQAHVFKWWGELSPGDREILLAEIASIPWSIIDPILPRISTRAENRATGADLSPAPVWPLRPAPEKESLHREAVETGVRALRRGKAAALTVAGGLGTRLGVSGPKGMVAVTPIAGKTLFQLFAEMIRAARNRYGSAIPWYILTSPSNDQATRDYFAAQRFFELPEGDVIFFQQGTLPAFDFEGRLLMADRHRLALASDGHGGTLKALVDRGVLKDINRRGVECLSYFQIDNPMVRPFDPLFLGLHVMTKSEMSTKVSKKSDDLERVGNVCLREGKLCVIEYTDFPEEFARARNADGSRRFDAGNLGIHLLNVGFIDRVVGRSFQLPIRRAEKIIETIDEAGRAIRPARPNGVKLETFVFDVLPLAASPLVLEANRAEEFSPVKNATGLDSLETSMRDQNLRACRWVAAAGLDVPLSPDGSPAVTAEISPMFALDEEELKSKAGAVPKLRPGTRVYLS